MCIGVDVNAVQKRAPESLVLELQMVGGWELKLGPPKEQQCS